MQKHKLHISEYPNSTQQYIRTVPHTSDRKMLPLNGTILLFDDYPRQVDAELDDLATWEETMFWKGRELDAHW